MLYCIFNRPIPFTPFQPDNKSSLNKISYTSLHSPTISCLPMQWKPNSPKQLHVQTVVHDNEDEKAYASLSSCSITEEVGKKQKKAVDKLKKTIKGINVENSICPLNKKESKKTKDIIKSQLIKTISSNTCSITKKAHKDDQKKKISGPKEMTQKSKKDLVAKIESMLPNKDLRKLLTPQNNYLNEESSGCNTARTTIPERREQSHHENKLSLKLKHIPDSGCATTATNSLIKQEKNRKKHELINSKKELNCLKEKIISMVSQFKQRESFLLNKNIQLKEENNELKKQLEKLIA